MSRNEKGEDWPKFLKEMQKLGPHLPSPDTGGSAIPILGKKSRQQLRAAGFKNRDEALQELERMHAIEEHKMQIIDEWFQTQMRRYMPGWAFAIGKRWPWLFQAIGFYPSFKQGTFKEPGDPVAYPCTTTRLYFRFFAWHELAANRHLWK